MTAQPCRTSHWFSVVCVAVDPADTDASLRVHRVWAFVLAVDCTTGKESLQSIARLDPASRNGAFFVEAELISLRGIDAIQTECGPVHRYRDSVFDGDIARPAWPDSQ